MIGDYTVLDKSMNGIKTLSDGISLITDGNATHDNLYYSDIIQSVDEQTTITNDTITTQTINCHNFNAIDITATDVSSDILECKRLYVRDASNTLLNILDVNGTAKTIDISGQSYFRNPVNLINYDFNQTQTSRIYQQGTNNNYLKDTYINGYLTIGSNLTQSGGSSSLKDLTTDNITLRENQSINQTGANVSNTLAGTTITKDLIILNSVVFPSNVTVPGTTTTDDIIMEGDSVIIQDLTNTTTKKNIFRNTKTLNLEIDGTITQIKGGSSATFKNTIIEGTAEIQGDITQTSGTTVLKTLRCNNITLNDDQLITISGTGYITQSGTGQNILKEISLLSNANLIFNGTGIINQPLNGINILSHFRSAGFGIIGGRNNTTYTNYQNIQNNNGLQLQFNRDNSTQYSCIMNNRGTGGNGGFRFQRYIGGVYLDEPLVIDDNITMNKNLSIPAGSLSCSSATIGNISQSELNCLDNCNQNINDKFISLDSQISSLQTTTGGVTTATTGITYSSGTDTTTIDNNLVVNKTLVVGSTNIVNSLNTNTTNINTLTTNTTGINYISGTDTTNIDNNVQIPTGKKLYIGTMDIQAEIIALETSFTTGTINSTNLTTSNLFVNNDAKFGQIGGTTYIKNDLRFCNVVNKSEDEFTQIYQGGTTLAIVNQQNNGSLTYQAKNNNGVMTEYMKLNSTSLNIKNTNVDIDTNLNVDGTTTLQNAIINNNLNVDGNTILQNATVNNDLVVNDTLVVTNTLETFPNIISSTNFTEQFSITPNEQMPTVDLATITITEPFSKEVNLNLSFSGGLNWRNGYLNISNRIQYTCKINYFTIYIYKNGVLWQSNVPQYNPQGLLYENTFRLVYSQFDAYLKFFLNNSLIKFLPDIKTTINQPDVYSIRVSFNFLYSLSNYSIDNENTQPFTGSFQAFTPVIYTNVSYPYNGSNTSLYLISNTKSYLDIVSYTSGPYAITSYSINGNVYRFGMDSSSIKEFQCVNSYTNTAKINNLIAPTASINNITNFVKMRSMIAAYMFNGSTAFSIMPIVCSIKEIVPADVDDYYLISPGYKLELYDFRDYGTKTTEQANDTNEPYLWDLPSDKENRTASIKVFYRNNTTEQYVEITYPNIS